MVPLRGLMPPYIVLHDLFEERTVAHLLDHTVSHQDAFVPTTLGSRTRRRVDPSFRRSMKLHDVGNLRQVLETKILGLVPTIVAALRVTPFEPSTLEIEMVAYGDGAFYKRHVDTAAQSDLGGVRVLTGVYYFHAEPKAFTGGLLRLHPFFEAGEASVVDIEPAHNSLVVFPSWAPHEVMPVHCPSQRFMDSRFAINCWVRLKKPDAARST